MQNPKIPDRQTSDHPQGPAATAKAADSRRDLPDTADNSPFGNGLSDAGPKRSQKQAGQVLADPQDAAPNDTPNRSDHHAE